MIKVCSYNMTLLARLPHDLLAQHDPISHLAVGKHTEVSGGLFGELVFPVSQDGAVEEGQVWAVRVGDGDRGLHSCGEGVGCRNQLVDGRGG